MTLSQEVEGNTWQTGYISSLYMMCTLRLCFPILPVSSEWLQRVWLCSPRAVDVPALTDLFSFLQCADAREPDSQAHLCECTLPVYKLRVPNPCVIIYDTVCKVWLMGFLPEKCRDLKVRLYIMSQGLWHVHLFHQVKRHCQKSPKCH